MFIRLKKIVVKGNDYGVVVKDNNERFILICSNKRMILVDIFCNGECVWVIRTQLFALLRKSLW